MFLFMTCHASTFSQAPATQQVAPSVALVNGFHPALTVTPTSTPGLFQVSGSIPALSVDASHGILIGIGSQALDAVKNMNVNGCKMLCGSLNINAGMMSMGGAMVGKTNVTIISGGATIIQLSAA